VIFDGRKQKLRYDPSTVQAGMPMTVKGDGEQASACFPSLVGARRAGAVDVGEPDDEVVYAADWASCWHVVPA
jgi:hypothetical protein